MEIRHLIFYTILIILFVNFSFQKEREVIIWSKDIKLKWEDFKLELDEKSNFDAISSIGFEHEYNWKKDTVFIKLIAVFTKNKSRVKSSGKTDNLLQHEQTHFNIQELFARRLRRKYLTTSFYKKTFQIEIDKNYITIKNDMKIFDKKYDEETNLSRNKIKQKEWNEKVERELKELEGFSNTEIKILLK
jgi:hypothetical protein